MPRDIELRAPVGCALVRIVQGRVLFEKTTTSTSVTTTTSGGGGYVNPQYGGHVDPVRTSTTVSSHSRTNFWVEEADGSRHAFSAPAAFGVGMGHEVRMVLAGRAGASELSLMHGDNLTIGATWDFVDRDLWDWASGQGLVRYPLLYRLVFGWSPWLLSAFILLVLAPVGEMWRRQGRRFPAVTDWSGFVQEMTRVMAEWSPSLAWQIHTGPGTAPWILFPFALVATLVLWLVILMVGYLLVGLWWKLLCFHPWRDKVLAMYALD